MRLDRIIDLRGEIKLLTGLHIGAGDLEMRIGGVDNVVICNPRNSEPYIPGSSLKGKIRSLLEWRSGAVQSAPLGLKNLDERDPSARAVLAILQLFGVSGDADMDDAKAKAIGPTRVSFHDAPLLEDGAGRSNLPIMEIKSENSIDRVKGERLSRQIPQTVHQAYAPVLPVDLEGWDG